MADVTEILVQWDSGATVSTIARSLGYSRPTVRKYVTAAEAVGLQRGAGRRSEARWTQLSTAAVQRVAAQRPVGAVAQAVDQFHDYLAARVGEVRLSVLHQRLRDEHGLAASWGSFYRYVRRHWPERLASAPLTTVRLDDPPPGNEAQVDFFYVGRWTDAEADRERKLYAFLMTLSHSRHQFLYPVLGEDSAAWQSGHVAAFAFFGGVPRRLVPDNLTPGVIKADRYDPRLHRAYGELARHYGCVIDPARVRRPTDKPRVERNVDYARESFFRGRLADYTTLAPMRTAAEHWARDVAGQRRHGTTGERPLVAFQTREQAALLPLPVRPWEAVTWTTALVQADCHLAAGGARYSVSHRYVGQRLDVRLSATTVTIYDGATEVWQHPRQARGQVTCLEHYPAAAQAYLKATPAVCQQQAQAIGPATTQLVATLLAAGTLTQLREVQGLLRLTERFEAARLEQACARALAVEDGRLRTVRGLLERGFDTLAAEAEPPQAAAGAFLRGPEAFSASTAVA